MDMKLSKLNPFVFLPAVAGYVFLTLCEMKPAFRERDGNEDISGLFFWLLPFIGGVIFTFFFCVVGLVSRIVERTMHKKVSMDVQLFIVGILFTALSAPLLINLWPSIRADMR